MTNPFIKAKAILAKYEPRSNLGVCGRLTTALSNRQITATEYDQAKKIIQRLLEGEAWLDDWLIEKDYATQKEVDSELGMQKMKTTRLKWCDHLAELWEAGVRE